MSRLNCQPIWPSNTSNELLYNTQRLFSRDNHNHDQVLGERTYHLPLLFPENYRPVQFLYCDGSSGKTVAAPYSTDNVMHQNWVPTRLGTNLNTPWGSDSDIYFDKVKAPKNDSGLFGQVEIQGNYSRNQGDGYDKYKDWLDTQGKDKYAGYACQTIDEKVSKCCSANNNQGPDKMVCTQTCVDWWTNRVVNPQGSMMPAEGDGRGAIGGGCPFNTVRALSCYPCKVHEMYVANTNAK